MILMLLLTIISVSSIGCSSSSDDSNQCSQDFEGALSSSEEIMVGKWVLTSATSDEEIDLTNDNEDNPSTNIYAQYSDCQKDSFYVFDNDRVMEFIVDSESTCNFHQEINATWELQEDILSFYTNCLLIKLKINLATDNSAFTTTSYVNIIDVNNVTTATTIVLTYNKN